MKNSDLIYFFGIILLGLLSESFLADSKYYPNFLNNVNPLYEGLLLCVILIIIFGPPYYLSVLLAEKIRRDSKKNLRSFKTLNEYYHNGNLPRVIKQTFITLPFYFYIKLKSDEPFSFMFLSSAIEKADISYWSLLIPYFICYYLIRLDFQNTNFDYKGNQYVDKTSGVQRLALMYGIWYGAFGWLGAACIDLLIFGIYMIRLII